MCGIVGLICKNPNKGFDYKHPDMFKEMLFVDTLRGDDSTGMFVVSKYGNVDYGKAAEPAPEFFFNKATDDLIRKIYQTGAVVVGHNRKATKGSTNDENAHPFKEQDIIMVHNGTIRNQKSLNDKVEVDSHAICHAMAEHGVGKALSKVDGAFAIAAYDIAKKQFYLARNAERPLYLAEGENFYAFASEPWMLYGMASRNGFAKFKKLELIPELKLYTFQLNEANSTKELSFEVTDVEKFKSIHSITTYNEEDDYYGYGYYPSRSNINQQSTEAAFKEREEAAKKAAEAKEKQEQDAQEVKVRAPAKVISMRKTKQVEVPALMKSLFPMDKVPFATDDIVSFRATSRNPIFDELTNKVDGFRINGKHFQYENIKIVCIEPGMSDEEVVELMKQPVLAADVVNIKMETGGDVTLYCRGIHTAIPYVTRNKEKVYVEQVEKLPKCKDCKEIIDEDLIEESVVVIGKQQIKGKAEPVDKVLRCFCPSCVDKNLQKNPKWCKLNELAAKEDFQAVLEGMTNVEA